MEWSIQQVAQFAGVTSRTLRHYDAIGLVPPARVASNGYRCYDEAALLRLQRVLLLRELGLSLSRIGDVVERGHDALQALVEHASLLRAERDRVDRRIAAVETTITALQRGEELMPETMFDGFDHTQHKDEVERRWGSDAYATSDRWWRGMDAVEQHRWKAHLDQLHRDWIDVAQAEDADPRSRAAQELARRHVEWLRGIPGTPAADPDGDLVGYVRGLADMYVADERFAAHFGGRENASFVREALNDYVDGLH